MLFMHVMLDGLYHIMRITSDGVMVNAGVCPLVHKRMADRACKIMHYRLMADKPKLAALGYNAKPWVEDSTHCVHDVPLSTPCSECSAAFEALSQWSKLQITGRTN